MFDVIYKKLSWLLFSGKAFHSLTAAIWKETFLIHHHRAEGDYESMLMKLSGWIIRWKAHCPQITRVWSSVKHPDK